MAPAGIDGGDEAVHKASRPKSSSQVTLCWGANSSRAAGPTPPIKGRFHRRSDEFLESIKKGVETPEKGRNAGEKLIPQGQAGGGGIKNQRINPMH